VIVIVIVIVVVVEGRYKDASYYLWILAVERVHHLHSKVRQQTQTREETTQQKRGLKGSIEIQIRGIRLEAGLVSLVMSLYVCVVVRWSVVCL
jgi:hypothetical protein